MADTGPLEGALPGVQDLPQPSRPIRIPREARCAVSLRKLQCVNGRPSFSGRVVAAATMTSMSASLIRGTAARPPRVQRGQAPSLNAWVTPGWPGAVPPSLLPRSTRHQHIECESNQPGRHQQPGY